MGNVSKEETMLIGGKSDTLASFSSGMILPVGCILLAFGAMCSEAIFFPFELRLCSFILFTAACLWDLRGLFYSSVSTLFVLLGTCPKVFTLVPSFVFFLIMINTCLIVALLKRMWKVSQKAKEKEIMRLKVWEAHYHVFRAECLDKLEEVKKAQESLFFMEEQVLRMEKERLEGFLEEDETQKKLIEQLETSQKECMLLQREVELLEDLLLSASKEAPDLAAAPAKPTKKRKTKEESKQGILF